MLKRFNVSDRHLNELIDEVFNDIQPKSKTCSVGREISLKKFSNLLIKSLKAVFKVTKVLFILFLLIVFVCSHRPTQRFVLRNSQHLIYPVMRQLRLLTLPLVQLNSRIVGWDVEECLVENPFYGWFGVQCWPCERTHKASDITDLPELAKQYVNNEKPFVVKNVIESAIDVQRLVDTYKLNKNSLDFGTAKVVSKSDSLPVTDLNHLMRVLSDALKAEDQTKVNLSNDIHIEWKMNRVEAIRVIRQVFPRPTFVPKASEVALQRFIFIDGLQSPEYYLPKTEFANVWLTQGCGYRLIVMEPSPMCAHNCSAFSVMLSPKDTLFYNWQLYRPRSLPARIDINHQIEFSDQISITFVASFY